MTIDHSTTISSFDDMVYDDMNDYFDKLNHEISQAKREAALESKRNAFELDVIKADKIIRNVLPVARFYTSAKPDVFELAYFHPDFNKWSYNEELLNATIYEILGPVTDQIKVKLRNGFKDNYAVPKICLDATNELEIVDGSFNTTIDFKNGRYDLLTGELKPLTPSMMSFDVLNYDKIDKCSMKERFDTFFDDLANMNSERAHVLKQIMYAALINFNPGKQGINLYGKAGGGKSTYLKVLVALAGGEDIYKKFSYSDLEKDDALSEIGRSKLLIGFDNQDRVVINRGLEVFKSLISKEPFSFFVKFQPRGINVFKGLFIQAFNDPPEFKTYSSKQPILDRMSLIKLEARFRHTDNEIVDYAEFLSQPHILSELAMYLIENVSAFNKFVYSDEKEMKELINEGDPVYEFFNEMRVSHHLANFALPASQLYAQFEQWFNDYNPNGKILSRRSFIPKIGNLLEEAGFVHVKDIRRTPDYLMKHSLYTQRFMKVPEKSDNSQRSDYFEKISSIDLNKNVEDMSENELYELIVIADNQKSASLIAQSSTLYEQLQSNELETAQETASELIQQYRFENNK